MAVLPQFLLAVPTSRRQRRRRFHAAASQTFFQREANVHDMLAIYGPRIAVFAVGCGLFAGGFYLGHQPVFRHAVSDQKTSEIAQLKRENSKLRLWSWRAKRQTRTIVNLRRLLNTLDATGQRFVTGQFNTQWHTAKKQAVQMPLGFHHGVKNQQPVLVGHGLLGLTGKTEDDQTIVTLLTDPKSRVFVQIKPEKTGDLSEGQSGLRGVLRGQGGAHPHFALVEQLVDRAEEIKAGDLVVTAPGVKHIPPGLAVGRITGKKGAWKVELSSDPTKTQYASILINQRLAKSQTSGSKQPSPHTP